MQHPEESHSSLVISSEIDSDNNEFGNSCSNRLPSQKDSHNDMSEIHLLVINPNSSQSVTDGLRSSLDPLVQPGTQLSYFTAPPHAPETIVDTITAIQTAAICYEALVDGGALETHDAFLVACFSDHPLTHMLREHFVSIRCRGKQSTTRQDRPVINILEASITQALLLGRRFAIITTGNGMKDPLVNATNTFLGGAKSDRFVDVLTTGLGVVELSGQGDSKRVKSVMMDVAADAARLGADVLILGCAGMVGMEGTVKEGVGKADLGEVRVVDGTKAGVELLTGLVRTSRAQS